MLYYLFEYFHNTLKMPGTGVFQYLSFRAALAILTSIGISMFFGEYIINFIRKKSIGETIRDLGLAGQVQKQERQQWVVC